MPRSNKRKDGQHLFNYYVQNCSKDDPIREISNELSLSNDENMPNHLTDPVDNEDRNSAIGSEIKFSLREKLAQWTVKHNITNVAINELLFILKNDIPDLPRDGRTLKETPRQVVKKVISGGVYIHYGIENGLKSKLSKNMNITNIILNFNIDGLPVSKSSGLQVWPILGSIADTKHVFVCGIFEGYSKPKNSNEYLEKFVEELKILVSEGIQYENKILKINVGNFICDAPARAFILNIKSHSGFFSCHKCVIKGQYAHHKIVFNNEDHQARTNLDFRQKTYPEHHTSLTPNVLELLPVDMVKDFPHDYMHVVCLGVLKSLLKSLFKERKHSYSISTSNQRICNAFLFDIRNQMPKEFNRKPRSMQELDRWKATELRQFLLYTGPIILHEILDNDKYVHFLKLSVAIRILLSHDSERYHVAQKLLDSFINGVEDHYGLSKMTYNVHCLHHLANDAIRIGNLNQFNAFEFENHLQEIKKLVRKKNCVGTQIFNRLVEKSKHCEEKYQKKEKNSRGSSLQTKKYYFSVKSPDNFCMLEDKVFKILSITSNGLSQVICAKEILNLEEVFKIPLSSKFINIFSTSEFLFSATQTTLDIQKISKCVFIEFNNIFYFIKLIH